MIARKQETRAVRNPESGAVVVTVAILWATMFCLAALAIDIGFLYQAQRGMQAAADAAVMAGLPQLATNQTTATNNAKAMATANGYTDGAGGVTVNVTPTATSLTVQITAPQPTFFAGVFGIHSRNMTVSAAGATAAVGPAIYAIDTNCSPDLGIKVNGGATIIKGSVESAGTLGFYTGPAATVNGAVTSACASPYYNPFGGDTWNGGPPTGGVPAPGDPFSYTIPGDFPVSKCSFGTNFSNATPLNANGIPGIWPLGQGPATGTLNSGIICSGSDILLNGSFITGTVTLVAYGTIELSGTDFNLTAAPGGDNLVAFSMSNSGSTNNCTSPANAIQIGSSNWTINGSLYAPAGCISAGGGGGFNLNGSLIGYEVNTSFDGTINPGGAAGAGNFYLNQ
jgi:Flp pilus assembly protein TadG